MKQRMLSGACKYCGQIRSFVSEEELTEEEIDEKATLGCDCVESMTGRVVEELFKNKPEILPLIQQAVPLVEDEAIIDISIKIDKFTKASIKLDGKTGRAKIRRTRTLTDEA
jgi:hypothetical protein